MRILFRVNSSKKIGIGHVMRSLVLAKKYKKDKVFFACEDLQGNINKHILKNDFEVRILKSSKIDKLISLIHKLKIDKLVIDNYDISYEDEKLIKEKTKVKILSFDDTYEKHFCDELLNHNIYAKQNKYKNLVPSFCKVQAGSKYTLLREEFKKVKNSNIKKEKNSIFMAMGGADHSNINIKILKVLKKITRKKQIKVELFTTSANINLEKLKRFAYKNKFINLHINSNNLAYSMARSSFAIVSASVLVNETNFLNLPVVAIKTASNQKYMYKYLKAKKTLTLKKFQKTKFEKAVNKMLKKLKA